MKIFLVDDDSFLLDMYETKFKEASWDVETAKSVESAIETLREGLEADVVLIDVVMPGMSGIDLVRTIKNENLGGAPRCIVLSNQGEQEDIDTAMEAGATGYIIKADTLPSEVVKKVNEYVS